MKPHDMATRVAALERSARRWRLATVAGLLLVVSTAAIRLEEEKREIRLVSPDGKRSVTIKADNSAAGVWVYGKEGVSTIFTDMTGAAAGAYGPDRETASAFISADSDGGTLVFQRRGKHEFFDSERLAK